ncbi:ATP-binding protein [uncultured Bacteroides sp.]|uniref:sensor histidine kinase n=1 Tax=uncultured Bacteroides sp. TaxID=162156 RepID=UPI0025FB5B06|nr:ATP-binding protein [uncultured Bacteroides sp.]
MNRISTIKLLFILVLLSISISSCTKKEVRRVLIVHSYEDSYVGYPQFNHLLAEEFKKQGIQADLRFAYLDCESYQEKLELEHMNNLLDSFKVWNPEIIIVNEDQATYSLLKCNHPMVKRLPIVFGGVNYPNWSLIKQFANVTGFHDKIDFVANIEMGKKIFGKKTNFFSILDSTFLDKKIRSDIEEQVKGKDINFLGAQFEYVNVNHNSTTYTTIPVRYNRGDGPIMWSLSKYTKNRCYLQIKRDFTTVNIGNLCSSPSLTAINKAFQGGEKLLGGYFTPLPIQVKEEVGAAIQILHGKQPSDIPIQESAKQHMIDWKVMEQLEIPISNIPANYTIPNIPFRIKYHTQWLIIIIVSSLLLLSLIIWLTYLYKRERKRKKKALFALADEKETLALAIEGSNTFAWKLEGDAIAFEKAFWQSLDLTPKRLTIDNLIKLIHPDYREIFIENWKRLDTAQKEIIQVQCDFDNKGYQWWEFRYTTSPAANRQCRTAGLLLNIQGFKEREKELEEAKQLAEKAELKESFLANMSHEIRTPLNAIVGFSTILAADEELDKEEKEDYIQAINHNNELLLKLINDILELSRLKSGNMIFKYEDCFVNELINNVYITHQMLIPKHLQFLIEEENNVRLQITTDKIRITQVITNLLNNACKFTKEGRITLGYRYVPARGVVEIFVEDTGKGINPEEQKMIFNRFYKQDEFAQGVGLGLSICQSIVDRLNGCIELWSEPGKGSRFTIILPCKVIF